MDARVRHVAQEMEARIAARLPVSELAAAAELSVAQLTRLFLRDTGLTPRGYLHRLRITRARWLLEHTDLPVAQIMTAVGIADRKHFARAFRLAYGSTPRVLRAQLRLASTAANREAACG